MGETWEQKVERQTRELQQIVWPPGRQSPARALYPNHPSSFQQTETRRAPQQIPSSAAGCLYPHLRKENG